MIQNASKTRTYRYPSAKSNYRYTGLYSNVNTRTSNFHVRIRKYW